MPTLGGKRANLYPISKEHQSSRWFHSTDHMYGRGDSVRIIGAYSRLWRKLSEIPQRIRFRNIKVSIVACSRATRMVHHLFTRGHGVGIPLTKQFAIRVDWLQPAASQAAASCRWGGLNEKGRHYVPVFFHLKDTLKQAWRIL